MCRLLAPYVIHSKHPLLRFRFHRDCCCHLCRSDEVMQRTSSLVTDAKRKRNEECSRTPLKRIREWRTAAPIPAIQVYHGCMQSGTSGCRLDASRILHAR
jgi:hypothetical protein